MKENLHDIHLNFITLIRALKELELMEGKVNDMVVQIFACPENSQELLNLHKRVNVLTEDMSDVENHVNELLERTGFLFKSIKDEASDAVLESLEAYQGFCSQATEKQSFIVELRDLNQQFEIEYLLDCLEINYQKALKTYPKKRQLDLLEKLFAELPEKELQIPFGFQERVKDLKVKIARQIDCLKESADEKWQNELDEIKDAYEELISLSCNTIRDFVSTKNALEQLKDELCQIQAALFATQEKMESDELHDLLFCCSELCDKVGESLANNLEALEYFASQELKDLPCDLFDCLQAQIHDFSVDEFRKLAANHLQKHRNQFEEPVIKIMKEQCRQSSAFEDFLEKIGQEHIKESLGCSLDERSFLVDLGRREIDEILGQKLQREVDDFDRYCYWLSLDQSLGGELEIQAVSEELKCPILVFNDQDLEKIINPYLPGEPLYLKSSSHL